MHLFDRIAIAAVRRSWTLHSHTVLTATTEFCGETFRVPIMHGLGLKLLQQRDAECRFVTLIRSLLANREGVVVDVGANVGRFLMYVAAADRSREYMAFEVHIKCAFYLKSFIHANKLAHHQVFPIGLADSDGALVLHTTGEDDVCASTTPLFYRPGQHTDSYPVCVMPGDLILQSLSSNAVDLIKVDVEGGELEVLRGLQRTIESEKPALIVEVAPYAHVSDRKVASFRRERALQLEALLRDCGYSFARIRNGDRLERTDTLDAGESTDIAEMDYLCLAGSGWESITGY